MFVRFKCRYSAKCGSSAPRSHRHKAVLNPAALTPQLSCERVKRARAQHAPLQRSLARFSVR